MIPSQYLLMAKLVAFGALVVAGVFLGYSTASHHFQPLLDAANKEIGSLQTANEQFKDAAVVQDNAIQALQDQAEAIRQRAEAAEALAQQRTIKFNSSAKAILLAKPGAGDKCQLARAAFDDELRQERGASK